MTGTGPATSTHPEAANGAATSAPLRVVLVLRDGLTTSQAVNAAAVLGATVGARLDLPLGPDGLDASGTTFAGIVTTPVPVLVADGAALRELFGKAEVDQSLQVACLTEVARRARTYDDYLDDLATTQDAGADLVAVCVAGPRNRVTKLTKRLSLLGADVGVP